MSSATPMLQVGAVVLAHVGATASWSRPVVDDAGQPDPVLVVQWYGTSVTLTGREALIALRAAIDEALKEPSA